MKVKVITVIVFLFPVVLFTNPALASNDLAKMVVVIDAGHGGKDPGASGYFGDDKKYSATESAYCYDVALRLERILKKKGAVVIMTTENNSWKIPIANKPNEVIPANTRAVFTLDDSPVSAGSKAISRRVEIANSALKKPGMLRAVFISIHFDVLGNGTLEGTRIIAGENANDLSILLEDEFKNESRVSNSGNSVLKNGDRSHGIKHLHILGSTNRVKQKALIELGNFRNAKDLWRIRDYRVRENYAQIVVRALIRLNAQPIKRQK
ncbi:MAG TPA: N-acetylmuramoyl-L-alanine amidase [Candidatus Moranbacteria bacterium]|nr:N-acetylmuramoyl-L-alanine amidase [Candidatus Moranbacteria bacterium]HSA08297.1 N-acetylmuramoyl-L-alanine amidase [Candidatus Moranbacteria bacterium]